MLSVAQRPLISRSGLALTISFVIIVGGFLITVAVANQTLYSAGWFVNHYLSAMQAGDADYAASMPGVNVPDSERALIQDGMLGDLSDIRILSETAIGDNTRVTFRYVSNGIEQSGSLDVKPAGRTLLLFPRWEFATSPLSTVSVRLVNSTTFRVNGETTDAGTGFYKMLVPGQYVIDSESELVSSAPKEISLPDPGQTAFVTIQPTPNDTFVKLVTDTVNNYLDACAFEKVMYPPNCPFGTTINDRLVGEPTWTITRRPDVSLTSASDGRWRIVDTTAEATVTGEAKRLADGKVSEFSKAVPFTVDYLVEVHDDLSISLHPVN